MTMTQVLMNAGIMNFGKIKNNNTMKKLLYIKANDIYYRPQAPFVKPIKRTTLFDEYLPVCYIKKTWFSGWQIDFYDSNHQYDYKGGYRGGSNAECYPNKRLILYPNSIQEICYDL